MAQPGPALRISPAAVGPPSAPYPPPVTLRLPADLTIHTISGLTHSLTTLYGFDCLWSTLRNIYHPPRKDTRVLRCPPSAYPRIVRRKVSGMLIDNKKRPI